MEKDGESLRKMEKVRERWRKLEKDGESLRKMENKKIER